jgi:hypothetical protein
MKGDIQQKWGKFDAQEITALKDKDDLVAQVKVKYGSTRARRNATSVRLRRDGSFSSSVAVVDAVPDIRRGRVTNSR